MNVRIIIMVFFPVFAIAQAPQKINFQSILRNSSGEVIGNSSVSLKISILSGSINGSSVYSETHAKITDASGLISLQIGNGTVVSGIFANIDWGGLSHFIKLEADFSGGSNYVVLGTQELMSVPYALYASKTDTSALNLTSRLATKLNATDTVSLSNRINANNANSGSFDTSLLNLTSRLATKLNVTDTAILSNRIDTKAPINSPTFTGTVGGISKTMVGLGNVDNTSDAGKPISSATQTALSNKLNKTDTSLLNLVSRFETKLNIADTSNMLLAYKTGLNSKLNKTDTASLSNRIDAILTKTDTASLSNRIDLKLTKTDTASLSNRIDLKLTKTDTASLSNRIDFKLTKTDTASLSNRIDFKLTKTDTASLSNRIDLKLTKTDTTSLSNRIDAKLTKTDTASLSNRIDLKLTKTDTTSLSNRIDLKLTKTDTASLSNRIDAKLTKTDTASLSNRIDAKLTKTDTASLSNRIDAKLTKTDTASLSERINTKLNSSVIDLGNQTGIIIYWDENLRKFRTLAPGTEGQVLKIVSGIPVWGTVATASVPAFSLCGTTISDIDGNSYNTVLIGAQCWTKENLRVRRYNNGTSILFNATGGSGGSSTTWTNLTIGAHTIYAHDSMTTPSNRTKYGYLYNWYAAKGIYTTGNIASTDTLNICPEGWHVPTDAEWTTLTTDLGGESVAGRMMKSIGTAFWSSQSAGTDNSSGFSALPGGYRSSGGSFYDIRSLAFFWSATEGDNYSAWGRLLNDSSGGVTKNYYNKTFGASVRCLRDY